ncbi:MULTISPECIES: hypothetical protein [unclassified Sphingomonas]|uniref:hypothetical protein n=1 Tax=unclassified Sphingomonas TaxID=196159 RepID=UPI0018D241C4|nr:MULTISPECIES: hypothetical protein [unclassified Sphingomonas]
MTANGNVHPKIFVEVNGVARHWSLTEASNHIVYFLAILSCLVDAIATGAHDVTIEIGNQTATRLINGSQTAREQHILVLLQAVKVAASAIPGKFQVL